LAITGTQAAAATVLFLSAAKMLSKIHLPSALPGSGLQARSRDGLRPGGGAVLDAGVDWVIG
jgi:hypothetical protein